MSQGSGACLMMRSRKSAASAGTTVASAVEIRHNSRLEAIKADIFLERSTNVMCAAPRESASMPTAPEPAHKSKNRAFSIRGASTLKSVSRRRSDVGRTCSEGGLFRFRPRYFPAITRIVRSLTHSRQAKPLIALNALNHSLRFHRTFPLLQIKLCFFTSRFEDLLI